MLDQAHELGLPFVYRGKQGTVPPPGTAELTLDVTSDETTLLIAPVIKTSDGADAVPLRFIGSEGHGVIYTDRGQANHGELARFRLARLAHPVPAQLQHLALVDERLVVPESGQAAFLSKYYPRLRRMAAVTSSDGSFTAPEISDPALVVRAAYARGHRVEVRWEWAYQVGGTELRAGLGSAPDPFRDSQAEARVLAGLGLPSALPGVPRGQDQARIERSRPSAFTLNGLDTMTFTTEVLPLLSGRDDVRLEVTGQVPDYREAGDSLEIEVSADERDGDPDWFDLGIDITVEGSKVPFAELFVALASGQSHLLLADGAYFSLDKPELAALARLIDEAQDAAGPAGRRPADQPVPGRAVGGTGRPGRGQPPGGRVAAAGQRAARHRGDRGRADPGVDLRAAAPVPAVRLPVARLPVGERARRHPRRRHGTRQDAADAGADPAREGRPSDGAGARDRSTPGLFLSWRRPPCWRTGRPRRSGSPPT